MKAEDQKVTDLIRQIVSEKGSCLVFCKHRHAIDNLAKKLEHSKISYVKIDGRSNPEDRRNAENAFQNGKVHIFLGSIGAAGEALTLTRADTCVFVEFDWVPAAMLQAEDRGHRIGQLAEKYNIIYLYADELETDRMMVQSLSKKIGVINIELNDTIDFKVEALSSKLTLLKKQAQSHLNKIKNSLST
jgi:superfamily II DNA or RNA helicase